MLDGFAARGRSDEKQALDRTSAQQLAQILIELNREENVTLILVTHAIDLAEKMQRQLELKDGKLIS